MPSPPFRIMHGEFAGIDYRRRGLGIFKRLLKIERDSASHLTQTKQGLYGRGKLVKSADFQI